MPADETHVRQHLRGTDDDKYFYFSLGTRLPQSTGARPPSDATFKGWELGAMASSLEQLEAQRFEQAWWSLAHSRGLPFALLAIATASNIVYAHLPLVAFAAMSGVMLTRQRAVVLALLIWLVNQGIGFGLRGYPLTGVAFAWGILMGLGTLLVIALASWRPPLSQSTWTGHFLWMVIAVLGGFVLYQGLILLAFPVLSDGHLMDWDIVARLFLKQLVWASAITFGHSLLLWRTFISSSPVEN